jgi:hypothetical protein
MQSLMGTTVEAITLHTGGADFTEALTDNYLKTKIAGDIEANRWIQLHVQAAEGEMLVGWPVTPSVVIGKTDSKPAPSSYRESAPNLTNALT